MDISRRYENTLVAILFFSWGTVFLDRASQHYLAPYFAPEFHLSHQQIGMLGSVVAVTWALSTLFFGALSDRVGRKLILVPVVFIFSTLSWISGIVHSFHQLLLVRALLGIAEGPAWSIMTAMIEESSHPTRRGRNIGIVVSAAALVGLAVAPVLTTQVAARAGWRWAFFVSGVPGFLLGLLIWKFVREPERGNASGSPGQPVKIRDFLSLLRYRNMWLCCAGAAGFLSWLFLHNIFAPLYITEVAHQAPTTAGFLMGASGLGSFFFALFFPRLSDRIGRKPVLLVMAAMSTMVPLALLIAPLYAHPLGSGGDRLFDKCRPGNWGAYPGARAHRKRSAPICGYRHRARHIGGGNYRGDARANPCWDGGPILRACRRDVDVGGRSAPGFCSCVVFKRDSFGEGRAPRFAAGGCGLDERTAMGAHWQRDRTR